MSDLTNQLLLGGDPESGVPGVNVSVGRVTVLLGANGVGKSRTLARLAQLTDGIGRDRKVVYVEGGRVVQPPDKLPSLRPKQVGPLAARAFVGRVSEFPPRAYADNARNSFAGRITRMFEVLNSYGLITDWEHYQEVMAWKVNGQQGEFPTKPVPVMLPRLFELFHAIFPQIHISLQNDGTVIECEKNGSKYPPSALSDGEKQVLCLLGEMAILSDPQSLILVDEPELNLNAKLACQLWDIIESERPDCLFIYGTHCLPFAMRAGVDSVIVLAGNGQEPAVIPRIHELEQATLEEFLGAAPGILLANKAIAVEGREVSFDVEFYRWITDDETVAVVPIADGCEAVRAASQKLDVWKHLAPSVRIKGVIDRDYRPDTELGPYTGTCKVLDLHEAESYLCDPKLVHAIGSALKIESPVPTEDQLKALVVDQCRGQILKVATVRAAIRATIRLAPGIDNATLSQISDAAKAKSLLETMAVKEVQKAEAIKNVGSYFDEELARCQKAVEAGDVEELLRVFPAKSLIAELAKRVGCKSPLALLHAAEGHLELEEWPVLVGLRNSLRF